MRYFLDTEFIEEPGYLDLLSIGIVREDGRELYLESAAAKIDRASQWVIDNVVPHMHGPKTSRENIKDAILELTADDAGPVEFWGYYSDYDWVAFCWLFGRMVDLPAGFPFLCRDLRQALNERGLEHIKQPDDAPHHALHDARWIAETWRQHVSSGEDRS